jgi:hypothetical protein
MCYFHKSIGFTRQNFVLSMRTSYTLAAAILFAAALAGCGDGKSPNSKSVPQDNIWQFYRLSYTEGEDKARFFAQFREGGTGGTALRLGKPAYVAFDFTRIENDSADAGGTYYSSYRDAGLVVGSKHTIDYNDVAGNRYDNSMMVPEFGLENVPAQASRSQPLHIKVTLGQGYALRGEDFVRLSSAPDNGNITVDLPAGDTSSTLVLSPEMLQQVPQNELILQATLYLRHPLERATRAGGKCEVVFTLKPVTVRLVP